MVSKTINIYLIPPLTNIVVDFLTTECKECKIKMVNYDKKYCPACYVDINKKIKELEKRRVDNFKEAFHEDIDMRFIRRNCVPFTEDNINIKICNYCNCDGWTGAYLCTCEDLSWMDY